ncbi:MAG: hypothetical protein AB1846_18840 [Chloroflexota bacterium]
MAELTPSQLDIVNAPPDARLFLSGPAGCGKTTAAIERMRALLEAGVPGDSILVLTPQRTLQDPYLDLIHSPALAPGGPVTPATVGGLARRMTDLFWPLAAEAAGFARPDLPPVFLTLETAQYYMAHLVRPLLDEGYFESVTINRNRLYSQIIDNLNKAVAVGFPYTEIGERLSAAWFGDPAQRRVYADSQACATRFRQYCLEHNLLDFSLQLEVFWNALWPQPLVRRHLSQSYRHLIYDNLEEDVPRAHDLIEDWLPDFDSALLIYDEGGGYRRFLGADPDSGRRFEGLCSQRSVLDLSLVASPEVVSLARSLTAAITPAVEPSAVETTLESRGQPFVVQYRSDGDQPEVPRYYPELLDSVADEIAGLIQNGLNPSEIVILAPYLSDALRFSLTNRLEARGIPWRSHRPSRSLRDEPATHALLTLAALAHPGWDIRPSAFDVTHALMQSIEGLDLVRANLLTQITYQRRTAALSPFEQIKPEVQERITYRLGNRFSSLREWILGYQETEPLPLDHFLRKLFGEILSQPGFGFHRNLDSAQVAASLVESVQKFRQALEPAGDFGNLGKEYIAMLEDGVIAAQYLEAWRTETDEAVLVAPAYTFLLMNRPVTVQFWLDAGAAGWYERLSQPLTQPFVLSRGWSPGRLWTDADEVAASSESLARLVSGLLLRCRERVHLGLSELGEGGFEQRGALLRAFQKVLTDEG